MYAPMRVKTASEFFVAAFHRPAIWVLFIIVFYWGLIANALAQSASKGKKPPAVEVVEFEQLSANVWMHTSYEHIRPWGLILSNGLIVTTDDNSAVLIDTAWNNNQTAQIVDWVREKLGREVISAVLTHAHNDKMGGTGFLKSVNIPTFANKASNEIAPLNGLEPAAHDLHFASDGNLKELHKALEKIDVYYPGPGHTVDNIVVYVPDAEVLFGGCLVRPGRSRSLGNTADGDIDHWDDASLAAGARFPKATIIVPSHGPPAGRELLQHTANLARRSKK